MALIDELRKAKFVVLRHAPEYYPYFGGLDISMEGRWYHINDVLGVHVSLLKNLKPLDRFEFREDGEWAQVYEVTFDGTK